MARNPKLFGKMLSGALHEIKRLREKNIQDIELELEERLGRTPKAIQKWKAGHIPSEIEVIHDLAHYIRENSSGSTKLDEDWFIGFLGAASYPYYEHLVATLFNKEPPPLPQPEKRPLFFTNVWFLLREKQSLFKLRQLDTGTLTVLDDSATYEGKKVTFTVSDVQTVQHVHLSGDLNNNWVKITYLDQDKPKTAYFANAKWLGIGNLIGGSEELFHGLHSLLD